MRYLLMLFCLFFFGFLSWNKPKCAHVYVAVQQDTLTIALPGQTFPMYSPPQDHDGQQLICVKCLHMRQQRVNYHGGIYVGAALGSVDTFMHNGPIRIDSFKITRNR